MASPVVQSSATNTATSATSVTVTAPSGITTGDLLVAYVFTGDTANHTHTTPSGWTASYTGNGVDDGEYSVFTKVAVSADESAPNYNFAFSITVDMAAAAILRINGVAAGSEVQVVDGEFNGSPAGGSQSFTVSATPIGNDTLILAGFGFYDTGVSTPVTYGTYASTPTETYTEVVDFGVVVGSNDGISLAVARADHDGSTEFTAISATVTGALTPRGSAGSIVIVNAPQDVNITPTPLSNTVAFPSPALSVGTTITPTPLSNTVAFPTPTLRATAPTQWTNESEAGSTWTNEDSLS